MLIPGKSLTDTQRQEVLRAFIYRWTTGNTQREYAWRNITSKPSIPLQSDEDWLNNHAFHFVADGSRLRHSRHAEPAYFADEQATPPSNPVSKDFKLEASIRRFESWAKVEEQNRLKREAKYFRRLVSSLSDGGF